MASAITPSFREISKYIGFILLFGIIAVRLYQGDAIIPSLVWGGAVYLLYNIFSIIIMNVLAKILHDFELQRMREMAEQEEDEEEEALLDDEDEE
ncbi:hypothetical protein GF324_13040 [bacterium]|nr:hypothetical protein [bacterium]